MNIDYSQFLNMIPEVTLTVILLIVFVVDLLTAQKASSLAIHQAENGELALAKEQVPAGVKAQGIVGHLGCECRGCRYYCQYDDYKFSHAGNVV